MKLNRKLVIWIFIISLIPLITISIIYIANNYNIEHNIKRKILTDKLNNIQKEITLWLEYMNQQVELLNNNKILNTIIKNTINEINETTINQDEIINNKNFILNHFNETIKATKNDRTGNSISEFLILDSEGKTILSTNNETYPAGSSFDNTSFYKYYKTIGISIPGIFGPLYHDETQKKKDVTTFALTSKIIDDENNFIGLIVAFTHPKKLNEIAKYTISSDPNMLPYSIYFYDEKERAISYPIIYGSNKEYPENFIKNKIIPYNRDYVSLPVTNSINTTFKTNKIKVMKNSYIGLTGNDVYGGWFWIDMATTKFGGVIELPIDFATSYFLINTWYYSLILIGLIFISLIFSYIITRIFINPVKKVSKQVSLIADGHILDKQNNIKSNNNDLGNISISINRLNVNLKNIVWNTQNDIEEIIKDAKVMKNDNKDLSKNIEDSKRVCRSTNNDLNELNQMIKDNVNSANNLKEKARKAINTATEGQDIVNRTMDSINNIDTFSKKISEIISVMDNIAFQTNLLSLNAAVESARSGEHGKGFSVLSAEIRSLAQRSKKAAKQISELIHTSGEKIEETVKLSNSSTKVYYQIFNDLKSVTSQIEEFSTRNKNQENGMDSIFHSIEDMVNTNEKNIELSDKIKYKNDMIISKSESILKVLKYFTISKNPEEELQIKLKKEEDNKNIIEKLDKKDSDSKQKKKNQKYKEKSDSDEYYDENTQLLVEKPNEEEEKDNESDQDDEEYIEEFIIDDNIITDDDIVEDIIQPIDDNKNNNE